MVQTTARPLIAAGASIARNHGAKRTPVRRGFFGSRWKSHHNARLNQATKTAAHLVDECTPRSHISSRIDSPLLPPLRLPRARRSKRPDASHSDPANDSHRHSQPQLPRDADDGGADGQRVHVVYGARVLGREGE